MRRTGILAGILLVLIMGCIQPNLTVKDEQQIENLQMLDESYAHIKKDLLGNPDADGQPQTQPHIPAKAVLDSHEDLLKEARKLEESKKSSWEEQARNNGWVPK